LFVDGHRDGAGQTVEQAYGITEQAVAEALGGIPEYKMRCSNLAPAAIRNAIDEWRRQTAGDEPET
jgi:nitrogen fixation NifU-like protein